MNVLGGAEAQRTARFNNKSSWRVKHLLSRNAVYLFTCRQRRLTRSAVLELDKVRRGDFDGVLNQTFALRTSAGTVDLRLSEVRALSTRPDAPRESFGLTFFGPPSLRLPQAIYHLSNASLGEMEIFIVQVGADRNASTFEAIFS